MAPHTLDGLSILVVEDEFLLAEDLRTVLSQAGAQVVGPAATIDGALALLATLAPLDGAILDINLHGEAVFAVADALAARDTPFIFTTGYDPTVLPDHLADVPCCPKPLDYALLGRAISHTFGSRLP